MIKYYCDVCETEVNKSNNAINNRVECETESGIFIEIMSGFKTWNQGCLCPKCFIEAVNDAMNKRFYPIEKGYVCEYCKNVGIPSVFNFVDCTRKYGLCTECANRMREDNFYEVIGGEIKCRD